MFKKIINVTLMILLLFSVSACKEKELLKLNFEDKTFELGDNIPTDFTVWLNTSEIDGDVETKLLENTTFKFYEVLSDENIDNATDETNEDIKIGAEINLDTLSKKVGKYIMRFTYVDPNNNKHQETKDTIIEIQDTTPPVFTEKYDGYELWCGQIHDFVSDFKAEDLSGEVKITVDENDYNLAIEGDYTIKVYAEDINGNKSMLEVPVNVKENKALNLDNLLKQYPNNYGNSTPSQNPVPQPTPEPTPDVPKGTLQDILNTANSYLGRTDMTCDQFVMAVFESNGYYSMSGTSWHLGYSVGTDINNVRVGDIIITHVFYPWGEVYHSEVVASVNGDNITSYNGGVNGTNVRLLEKPKDSFFAYDDTEISDIRRVF